MTISLFAATTSLPNVNNIIAKRQLALFGHVVRLVANTPAHQILKQAMDVKSGHQPNDQWRKPPGRPCNSWLQQINNGSLTGIRHSWTAAVHRGHRRLSLRASAAYVLRWWRFLGLADFANETLTYVAARAGGRQNCVILTASAILTTVCFCGESESV